MDRIKILTLKREVVLASAQLILLVGTATLAPLLRQQMITGPVVNATLFIATVLLGTQSAILVGLIPSLIALMVGLLSPVLAPMVPFIMVGNTLLIIVFGSLWERDYWVGMVAASVLKFLFLFSTSSVVIDLLLKKEVVAKVAMMMSWPQLFTALTGGLIAYLVLKGAKKV